MTSTVTRVLEQLDALFEELCASATELLRRALRTDASMASQFVREARVAHRERLLSSGIAPHPRRRPATHPS